MTQATLETWEQKALRLAQEVQAAYVNPFIASAKQRDHYRHLRYALRRHLEEVPSPQTKRDSQ